MLESTQVEYTTDAVRLSSSTPREFARPAEQEPGHRVLYGGARSTVSVPMLKDDALISNSWRSGRTSFVFELTSS